MRPGVPMIASVPERSVVHEGPKGAFSRAILPGAQTAEAFTLGGQPMGQLVQHLDQLRLVALGAHAETTAGDRHRGVQRRFLVEARHPAELNRHPGDYLAR